MIWENKLVMRQYKIMKEKQQSMSDSCLSAISFKGSKMK